MSNIMLDWRRQDEEALARVRAFNKRFFGAREEERTAVAEHARTSGLVFGRLTSRPSLPEVLRRLRNQSIPKPKRGEIQQKLYPKQ